MTREEERIKHIDKFASQCYEDVERYSAFISGAIWADNNPVKVWHDACECPEDYYKQIIYQDKTGTCHFTTMHDIVVMLGLKWEHFAASNISQWAYISDLLPKGGKR